MNDIFFLILILLNREQPKECSGRRLVSASERLWESGITDASEQARGSLGLGLAHLCFSVQTNVPSPRLVVCRTGRAG